MSMNIEETGRLETKNEFFVELYWFEKKLQKKMGKKFNKKLFQAMLDKGIIITVLESGFSYQTQKTQETCKYISTSEYKICQRLFDLNYEIPQEDYLKYSYDGNFWVERIKITPHSYLVYELGDVNKHVPSYVRNIIYFMWNYDERECELTQFNLAGATVVTTNRLVCNYIDNAMYRKYQLDNLKTSTFANSSAYMGSKRKIIGFIIESIFPQCDDNSVFLDIMCGSGAVSNAFAQMGKTYASDAQEFCRLLAKVQGRGFSGKRAKELLNKLYKNYMYNLDILQKELSEQINEEDKIFHLDLCDVNSVLEKYKKFINNFELYSTTYENSKELIEKINERKQNREKIPYCLFTYYFANVYFGLAQCIQLDSLRYAIDQISNKDEKEWALGALVVTVSSIATQHAGHFAQPKRLDEKSLKYFINQRVQSAWLEFSKRFITLAEESERYSYHVKLIEGPWKNALTQAAMNVQMSNLIVYLDAPYKRDEYSRYYHVLETIVKYDYPSSENKGRMRSKNKGERFNSEFFTKTISKVEDHFVSIISEILIMDAVCAWSYSNNGAASIRKIVSQVRKNIDCEVFLYSTPYQHISQRKKIGTRKSKLEVLEYCIVFVPNREKIDRMKLSNLLKK